MTYNQDFVEARAEDIFEDWVKSFFVDLTPLDESALFALALDQAIEEALWEIFHWPRQKNLLWSIFFYSFMIWAFPHILKKTPLLNPYGIR